MHNMGWDAYAIVGWDSKKQEPIRLSAEHKKEFAAAAIRAKSKSGRCDPYLIDGGLDYRRCGQILSVACDYGVYVKEWPADLVGIFSRTAKWNPEDWDEAWMIDYDEKEDAWAYWSAKEFLETCAKLGLAIRFSW